MSTDKVYEELEKIREHFLSRRESTIDYLINVLEELTPFELGRYQGLLSAYDGVFEYVREKLKHGIE